MGNTAQITSDLQYVIASDCTEGGKLPIGNRGVLLSVLGNNLTGSPVTADLDKTIADKLRGKKAFYEFDVKNLDKNHICISYQEQSNTVFIIGVTDVFVGFAAPQTIDKEKVKTIGVKLKASHDTGLIAQHVLLVRLEGTIAKPKNLAFYLLDTNS